MNSLQIRAALSVFKIKQKVILILIQCDQKQLEFLFFVVVVVGQFEFLNLWFRNNNLIIGVRKIRFSFCRVEK